MKQTHFWQGIFLLFALIGCYAGDGVEVETRKPVAVVPTVQPTREIEVSVTAVSPTYTATSTLVPTNTAVSTSIPTPLPLSSPTPDIAATLVAGYQPRVYDTYPSPDGRWQAEVLIYDCVQLQADNPDGNAYEQLVFVDTARGEEKVADSQLQYCGGLGAGGLLGLFWSEDSRYFYYTTGRTGFPDGCGHWERPYSRVDVTNWESEFLGGGPISPDGTKLATWQAQELIVWDVMGGEIVREEAAVPTAQPGPIVWSPENDALVYSQYDSFCPLAKSYIVLFDLASGESRLLIESDAPTFGSITWTKAGQLSMVDESGTEWQYDFTIEKLKPVP